MVNWLPAIPITGNVIFPQVWESSAIFVRIASPTTPVWRKAGYLTISVEVDGESIFVDRQIIEFGKNLITVPVTSYKLSFEPVPTLTTIYPNTTISIYQLSPTEARNIRMSNSFDPGTRAVGPSSEATVAAAVTNTVLAAANLLRSPEGIITNNSNKNLWVTFKGVAATTAPPCKKVLPNGGNIDIPGGYTGVINGIWEAAATGSCVVDEFSYI
jgi:hypothetical protein